MKKKAAWVLMGLKKAYPDAGIALHFNTSLELLVATMLSAQCTDVRVNQVTAGLFKEYKKPEDYLSCSLSKLEKDIHSTGFFRQKAKSLRGVMECLVSQHQGQVPTDMDALTRLPGVGRKTANVLLGNAYKIPGIAVDTHVGRVSQRIGLTSQKNPDKIEADLNQLYPKKEWIQLSHTFIFHGRLTCKSRKPLCDRCAVTKRCDDYEQRQS